jgi:LmbE family N-acetylglucosaminyl deacetylase
MRKEVAAERNHLPTKALRTLGEDAHRLLGLPIACSFWTVQNIFSILTCVLARGEPRMFFVQLPEAAGKAVRPPALEPLPLNRLFGQLSQI